MSKNYYLVLGITSDATLDDIKNAYRKLVKEFHPDRFGNNLSPFLAIQEAYAVLSDPVKRQNHDGRIQHQKRDKSMGWSDDMRHHHSRKNFVEPLIPEQGDPLEASHDLHATRVNRYPHSHFGAFDRIFEDLFSHFRATSIPMEPGTDNLDVMVSLTPEEAMQGGQLNLSIPASIRCHSCRGQGWIGGYVCWRCNGEGRLSGEYPIMINYPPGLGNNHAIRISLDPYGFRGSFFTIHFSVG